MTKDNTQKIVHRHNALPGDDWLTRNLLIDPTTVPAIIKYRTETFLDDETVSETPYAIPYDENYQSKFSVSIIETSNHVEWYFLMITPAYNQYLCLKIVKNLDIQNLMLF